MRKANFFLAALILWGLLFWYLYVFIVKNIGAPQAPITPIPATQHNISESNIRDKLLFHLNDYAIAAPANPQLIIDSILNSGQEGQYLKITGFHHTSEAAGLGYDLGWARASELKKKLMDYISEDRIELYSDTIRNFNYTNDSLVEAIVYEWIDGYEPETVANYYLLDHDTKRVKTENFDQLLTKIADRLVNTKEKVLIIGHTDAAGDKELNFTIGLRNAKDIRDLLKEKGVKHQQITTSTRGEEAPIAENETEIGKRKNRRIEIKI